MFVHCGVGVMHYTWEAIWSIDWAVNSNRLPSRSHTRLWATLWEDLPGNACGIIIGIWGLGGTRSCHWWWFPVADPGKMNRFGVVDTSIGKGACQTFTVFVLSGNDSKLDFVFVFPFERSWRSKCYDSVVLIGCKGYRGYPRMLYPCTLSSHLFNQRGYACTVQPSVGTVRWDHHGGHQWGPQGVAQGT